MSLELLFPHNTPPAAPFAESRIHWPIKVIRMIHKRREENAESHLKCQIVASKIIVNWKALSNNLESFMKKLLFHHPSEHRDRGTVNWLWHESNLASFVISSIRSPVLATEASSKWTVTSHTTDPTDAFSVQDRMTSKLFDIICISFLISLTVTISIRQNGTKINQSSPVEGISKALSAREKRWKIWIILICY